VKLGADSLADLAGGAAFLATGGGGDPYVSYLSACEVLERNGPVDLIGVESLDNSAFVATIGGVGAPSVSLELLPSTDDPAKALTAFEKHIGRSVDAVVSFEIGGGNSLIPLMAASEHGIPVVDGDGMGRALPEAQMMTYPIAGIAPTPALALDYMGNTVTFETDTTATYERHIRAMASAMGGMVTAVEHPMTGRQLKSSIVAGTVSFSIELGRVLRENRGNAQRIFDPLREVFAGSIYGDVFHVYTGKVVDYSSAVVGGYDVGQARVESFDDDAPPLVIDIKNEYLVARIADQVAVSVPDLITVLDYETSTPINAERLRFGQRVSVYGVGCPAFYRQPTALDVVGPRCFGFDFDFTAVEDIAGHHQQMPR
jgi:DUF917 family protein